MVDGLNGFDKTILDMFFGCLILDHPAVLVDVTKCVMAHTQEENGTRVSLAQVCYGILSNQDQSQDAGSNENRVK